MKRPVSISLPVRLLLLLALCALPTAVPLAAPYRAATASTPLARWLVTWSISGSGTSSETTSDGVSITYNATHSLQGRATFVSNDINYIDQWSGSATQHSMDLQGQQDNYYRIRNCPGYLGHLEFHWSGPAHYANWSFQNVVVYKPTRVGDGTWTMKEPSDITIYNGALWNIVTQDTTDDPCASAHNSHTNSGIDGTPASADRPQVLQGNADGTVFTISYSYDESGSQPPLHLTRTVTVQRLDVGTPRLSLDSELLDRSIFLDQVSLDDRFDAKVDWGNASGGRVDFRLGPADQPSDDTTATDIPDHVDMGTQGVGTKQLTAQALPDAGKPSNTVTKAVVVAPPPAWCGSSKLILAAKQNASVAYNCSYAWPDPAFEATVNTPPALPFFRGQPLGIKKTQLSAEMELKSTGEGSVEGKAQTGFVAMGNPPIMGSVKLHGDLKLSADGVTIPAGGIDFTISGKLKKEEGLLDAIPTLTPVMATIDKVSPAASAFLKQHAKVTLELEPKLVLGFNFVDKNGEMVFKNATLKPGIGFKVIAELNIIDKFATAKVSVGGSARITLQVPAPYFKQVDLALTAGAEIELGILKLEAEKEYSWSSGGAGATHPGGAPPQASASWQVIDRSYLQAPDYARWTGVATNTDGFVDQQLVGHLFPVAHPALAALPGSGEQYLVWSHDQPNSDPLNGQELMFAKGGSNGWASQPVQLTSDDRADLNPQLVTLPDGTAMVLWQRLDSPTPGDINADPQGYLSHFQVAAGTFNPNDAAPVLTPVQLSTSGNLNYRHHLGALSDGALAVWATNPANQLLGDATHPDTIYAAHYDHNTKTWGAPVPVVPTVAGLLSVQLATNGSHAALVYAVDTDGDLATTTDRELFYVLYENGAWGSPRRLTTNSVPDEDPHLGLTATGTPLLVWQQNGQLLLLSGSWTGTPSVVPIAVDAAHANWDLVRGSDDSLALTWQQLDGNDTTIGYAIYDANSGTWSAPQTIRPPVGTHSAEGTSAFVSHVAPVLESGVPGVPDALVYGYQLASVQPVTRTVEGVAVPNQPQLGPQTLRVGHLPLTANLHLTAADVQVTPVVANAGDPVTIRAAVHNTGQRGIPGAVANLVTQPVAGSTQETVVATQTLALLPGGGTVTTTFSLTRPALADRQYLVKVSAPQGMVESDTTDNEAPVGMDVAGSAVPTIYTPDGALLGLVITTTTGLPPAGSGQAMLTLDRPDGLQLEQASFVFPITPTASVTATTWLPTSVVGPGHHQLFWTIDPSGALGERSDDHRVVATSVDMLPDLTTDGSLIDWSSAPGSSTFYRVPVQNTGAYTSTGGVLALYDGVPGTTTTHTLLRQPLPTLRSGATAVLSGTLSLAGLPAATTGLQGFYVVLDPDNVVAEITKNNNTAIAGNIGGNLNVKRTLFVPLVER